MNNFNIPINKAMLRPMLVVGVEKRLVMLNSVLCFPLVAATHFHFPSALIGIVLFVVLHRLLVVASKYDPQLGLLIKRSSRYAWRPFYLAKSHPNKTDLRAVKSIGAS